jgi:hypothetical protein
MDGWKWCGEEEISEGGRTTNGTYETEKICLGGRIPIGPDFNSVKLSTPPPSVDSSCCLDDAAQIAQPQTEAPLARAMTTCALSDDEGSWGSEEDDELPRHSVACSSASTSSSTMADAEVTFASARYWVVPPPPPSISFFFNTKF